jgi:UDP-glucose 4-epimerase
VVAVERFDEVLSSVGALSTVINLGTGDGITVREFVQVFQKVYGKRIPVREAPPRPGDAVGAFANVDKARNVLGWRASLTIEDAIASALAWGRKRKDVLGYE